ncbi:DnaJ domain-containing protein [Fusobacterium sp. PH5-44]|uniref:J domain-containing protein n=1 Tax=unclassified Fusobacterium TaxID=2648384 RepID=UPI003D262472
MNTIITMTLCLTVLILIMMSMVFRVNKAYKSLPFMFMLSLLISMIVYVSFKLLIIFFPLIAIWLLLRKKNPKSGRKYYRFEYTKEEFDDFQRRYKETQTSGPNLSNYYKILNVNPGSTKDEVKKSYRDLVKQHHPDKYVNATQEEINFHEKKLKEINDAYEVIIKRYDN